MDIAGSIAGIAAQTMTTILNNRMQRRTLEQDRAENYRYNEMAADNAMKRQMQMIEQYYTPQAQLKQLQDAGLSPSLMYGGSGTTGTTTAPQGAGASGLQTPYHPFDPLIGAQIANIVADTDKKKAETGTELLDQEQKKLQNDWQGIQNYIAEATKDTTIEQVQEQVNSIKAQIDLVKAQTKVNQIEYDFKSANFDNALTQEMEKTNQLICQTFEIESKERLNDAQTAFIKKQVENYEKELNIKLKQVNVQEEGLKVQKEIAQINKECQDNFVKAMRDNAELMGDVAKRGQWFNLAGDIIHCATDIAENYINPAGKAAENVTETIKDVRHFGDNGDYTETTWKSTHPKNNKKTTLPRKLPSLK